MRSFPGSHLFWFPGSGLGTHIHEAPLRVLNEVINALLLEAELREETSPSRSLGTRGTRKTLLLKLIAESGSQTLRLPGFGVISSEKTADVIPVF